MRHLILTLTLTAAALSASELPLNLLRFNSGALPMVTNKDNHLVVVTPADVDWNANYAAILTGNIGKSVNLTGAATKSFVVNMGSSETINRVSLYSTTATGTLRVYSSPVLSADNTLAWSELGALTLLPGKPATLNTSAQARYIKFIFSDDSQGLVASMGVFGKATYANVQPPAVLQSASSLATYNFGYGTPATSFSIVSSTPAFDAGKLMALFDDDPATVLNIAEPLSVIVDFGAARQIDSMKIGSASADTASVVYGSSVEELATGAAAKVAQSSTMSAFHSIGAVGSTSARFARISFGANPSIEGVCFVGSILPEAFVFTRVTPPTPPAPKPVLKSSDLPAVHDVLPRILSPGGNE